MQKSMVMSMMMPSRTLMTYDHHIARGTIQDASSTSSAISRVRLSMLYHPVGEHSQIWTMLSEPRLQYTTVT